MSRNFISYSLFKPKKLYAHRTYDPDKEEARRYWYNLPALTIINSILYPNYEMRLSVCPDAASHPLFKFYKELCLKSDKYSFSVITDDYSGHEPALWRMKLLWEQDAHIVLSRDIDSVPNVHEYQSTVAFERSNYAVHTIRSHPNHYNYPCRMLIGLSGFKPTSIPSSILTGSFEKFKQTHFPPAELLSNPTVNWNADQLTVINAFTTDEFFTSQKFLDTRIDDQTHYPDFFCRSITPEDLSGIRISETQKDLFSLVVKFGLADWAGQPCDARSDFLKSLTRIASDSTVLEILESDATLQDFYLA
tara:strand:+ start:5727 stop:6641 length:915 start_codon:yes stop_codon:yes gene_type:complete